MDALLQSLSVCEYKTYPKRKTKNMPTLEREPMQFVSEEYCVNALS
jgi:hypothetical protein